MVPVPSSLKSFRNVPGVITVVYERVQYTHVYTSEELNSTDSYNCYKRYKNVNRKDGEWMDRESWLEKGLIHELFVSTYFLSFLII